MQYNPSVAVLIKIPNKTNINSGKKSVMIVNLVELEKAIVEFYENGIVHVIYKEGVTIDTDLHRELKQVYADNGHEQVTKLLISSQDFISAEKIFWDYCKKSERFAKGQMVAVVAPTLAKRLLASNYLLIYKPSNPYRIFENHHQAVSWLTSATSIFMFAQNSIN